MDFHIDPDRRNCPARHKSSCFSVPLVSVIVVNFNYGRFLMDAVASVFAQTYPHIECIVVDDGSTDESGNVLNDIQAAYPEVFIIRLVENNGQSLASKLGYQASGGEYVVFLDADDYLLPRFIETHIFVHLSLRIPVGLSSSDMAQAVETNMVVGTGQGFSDFVRSNKGRKANLVRRFDENAGDLWPLSSGDIDVDECVHYVPPCNLDRWVWSNTSGNCFRRDALRLFLENETSDQLRTCTDGFLVRGIAVLTGSVLIDRTLAIYRLHGRNAFSRHPHLDGILSYDRGGQSDKDQQARVLVIDHMIANAALFARKVHSLFLFMRALRSLNNEWPRLPTHVAGCRSYVAGQIVLQFAGIAKAIGLRNLVIGMCWLGIAPWVILRAIISSRARL